MSERPTSNNHPNTPPPPPVHSNKMLKRAVGWLKDKTGGGSPAKGKKRSRDAGEEQEHQEQEIDVWADDHLMYACPFARLEQSRPQPPPSSLLPSASDVEAYEDVDLSSDAGNEESDRQEQTGESSPPPPSYHSFAATTGLRLEAPSSLLMHGSSERVLPLLKRARHTQTDQHTSNKNSTTSHAALPDVYLDFFDVFDLPSVPPQQHGQEGDDGDNLTMVDDGEEGEEEEELRALADDDKAALGKDDDDDHSLCSSPLFPVVAAKSEEDHHVQSNSNDVQFVLAGPASSVPRPFTSASSSPDTIIYTFTSEMALRALVAPEALGGCGGAGQRKDQREAVNVKNDEDEDEDDTLALFGPRPAKTERVGVESAQAPFVIWERVEALVDCKVELSEEGCSVSSGPDLQGGVPLLFGIETETFWAMEDIVCVNLYRSAYRGRSLLLLAKHASQRPPWAPERLELVVVSLDTKGNEQNAAAMLSLLAPAHARGPAKGGVFEMKYHVFEGRGELGRRLELADLVALLNGHDGCWNKVGCSNVSGGQYKRKLE